MKIDLNKFKVFFFDFDGVIVDSLDIKTEAFGELFSKHGKDISCKVMDYHRNNGGVSRYDKFKYYYKNLLCKDLSKVAIGRLDKGYSKLVVKKVIAASYILGALNFIKMLNKKQKDCFIISGTPQKEIRYILKRRKIAQLFKEALGSPVNKTDNLRMLISKHKIDPSEAIFFGDAKSDYVAAKENKVSFVRIVKGKRSELYALPSVPRIKDFVLLANNLRKTHDSI